jgi:hypothetical protein
MSKVIVIEFKVSVIDEEANSTEHKIVGSKMEYATPREADTELFVKRTKEIFNNTSFDEQVRLISGNVVALVHQTLRNKS